MKAVILAGGLGTRLKTVIPHLPKPMAPINNRPFLEYLMDYWIDQGVDSFCLSLCHMAEVIQSHFKESYRNCPIEYIKEPAPLGTGGAILYCLSKLDNSSAEVVVLNGDTFVEVDLQSMLRMHQRQSSNLTIALRKVENNDRYSGVELDENSQIKGFFPRGSNSPYLLINAGVYLLTPKMMMSQRWHVGEKFSIEDDFFPEVIKKQDVYGFLTQGKFIDIGIPSDYQRGQSFFCDVK